MGLNFIKTWRKIFSLHLTIKTCLYIYMYIVGSQIVAHTLTETGNGPNRPNTINL